MYRCCFITDEIQCTSEATEIFRRLPVCGDHRTALSVQLASYVASEISVIASVPGFTHTPGITYVLLTPDNRVKIGYTGTVSGAALAKRWQNITKDQYPGALLTPVATLYGGRTMERVIHFRFRESRLDEYGERFTFTQDIRRFVTEAGHVAEAAEAADRYLAWFDKHEK